MPMQRQTRRSSRKVMTLTACAVLVAAVAVSGVALAHNVRHASTITFTSAAKYPNGKAVFKGNVNSAKAACKNHREVQVFRVGNPDRRIGRGFTLASGSYKIVGTRPAVGAELYTLTETKVLNAPAGHNHVCDVDFSPHLNYPHP